MKVPTLKTQALVEYRLHSLVVRLCARANRAVTSEELARLVRQTFVHVTEENGIEVWEALATTRRAATEPDSATPSDQGLCSVEMTPAQRQRAEAALWYSSRNGIRSSAAAVRAFALQQSVARGAPIARDCLAERLAEMRAANFSLRTIANLQRGAQRFMDNFGERRLCDCPANEIVQFFATTATALAAPPCPQRLSTFFEWALQRRYVIENPIPRTVRRLRRRPSGPIFTPRQVRLLLRRCRHTDQIGSWVLTLFAGLNGGELSRLERYRFRWRLVRWRRREFHLPSCVTGREPRTLSLTPLLCAWLKWLKDRDLPFWPKNAWEKGPLLWRGVLRRYPDDRTKHQRVPPPMPRQGFRMGRNTYLAYRLATPNVCLEQVAHEMGCTVRQLHQLFSPVPSAFRARRARDFFELTPARLGP